MTQPGFVMARLPYNTCNLDYCRFFYAKIHPDLISHKTCRVQIYISRQNCTNSTAVKNIIFYSHFTSVQNGVPLKLPNVYITCDWLSWLTPHSAPVALFDRLKIWLTPIKSPIRHQKNIFYPVGKEERLG